GILFDKVKGIFKAPSTNGAAFAIESGYGQSLILAGINSLLIGLMGAMPFIRINGMMKSFGDVPKEYLLPSFKFFWYFGILAFAMAAAYPAALMLVSKIFKSQTGYKQMLGVSGVFNIMMAPFSVLSILTLLIMPFNSDSSPDALANWLLIFAFFFACGIILGLFAAGKAAKGAAINISEDGRVWFMFLSTAAMLIVYFVLTKIFDAVFGSGLDSLMGSLS
ncbi:MAG: hypothetical protein LBI38_04500, partial [Oscillospiraceae bacterium]|nr:hypothetical protein [Oscillospiraceae bacterium]